LEYFAQCVENTCFFFSVRDNSHLSYLKTFPTRAC